MPDLPVRPDLDQLRHQAKDLLHAAQRGDPDAIARIEAVSDRLILASAHVFKQCVVLRKSRRFLCPIRQL